MSKQDKQARTPAPPKHVRETWVRLRRNDYLTSAVEVLTLEGGIEVERKTVHPPDIARIALNKGYSELERMVEDR